MKYIFTKILLITFLLLGVGNVIIAEQVHANSTNTGTTRVLVTEKVPGANCVCAIEQRDDPQAISGYIPANGAEANKKCENTIVTKRAYICEHQSGLAGFQGIMRNIIHWIINVSVLLGVLAIASLGIAWMLSGSEDTGYKKFLKGWIINLIIGLIILFMFRYILSFIAPWIFQ